MSALDFIARDPTVQIVFLVVLAGVIALSLVARAQRKAASQKHEIEVDAMRVKRELGSVESKAVAVVPRGDDE